MGVQIPPGLLFLCEMKKKAKKIKAQQVSNSKSEKVTRLPIKGKIGRSSKKESIFGKIDRFFKEARTELTKVKWPSQKELIASTIAVIIICLIFAFFLGIVDIGIVKILKHIIR